MIQEYAANNVRLSSICQRWGIERYANIQKSGYTTSTWGQATTIEAIVGASYRDGGEPAARKVMNALGIFNLVRLQYSVDLHD